MNNPQQLTVSYTAKVMAAARACESKRNNALFIDPFAEKLAGKEVMESVKTIPPAKQKQNDAQPYLEIRTRFFDDFLLVNIDHIDQVVLLGAGLDTRAFRLDLPSNLNFYEVDQESVIDYKNKILANNIPHCMRRCIASNLEGSQWVDLLLKEGFKPEKPTIWILEGFIYYLTEKQARILMSRINDLSALESYLGCDLINETVCNDESKSFARMWQFSCNEPEAFLAEYGWHAKVVQPSDKEAWFGRFTFQYPPREDKNGNHIFLATAIRKN